MDELIRQFNAARIRYLVIGGQAVRLKGLPRFSMDWDFFIPRNDSENLAQINSLLADEVDLPLLPLGPRGENFVQTYQTRWGVLQFHLGAGGLPPFEEAERAAVTHVNEHGTPVRCVSGLHLLKAKEAANRPQDQQDIEFLRQRQAAGNLE